MTPAPARYSFLLPAAAMMLGWGLRGFIGGGPLGAMIPGAMVVLSLCLLHPRKNAALLAAFGAIGVGIGGEMTYGQTVGFIVQAETFWWGFLGLALKGAIWGALAGPILALVWTPRPRVVAIAGAVTAAATWLGWKFINQPKLIYFSNRLDRPREEVWAGFLFGAIALTAFLAVHGFRQPALRLAVAGLIGGGIGFGLGGAIQGLGRIFTPDLKLHWWKYMEFYFGFCFGWALAWAFAKSEAPPPEPESPEPSAWLEYLAAAAAIAAIWAVEAHLPVRFAYALIGLALLAVVTVVPWLARHVAYTATFAFFAFDLARHWATVYKGGAPEPAYALAILAGLAYAGLVRRWHGDTLRMLELLTWSAVAVATLKFAINPAGLAALIDHVELAFVLMAVAVSVMARRARPAPASCAHT